MLHLLVTSSKYIATMTACNLLTLSLLTTSQQATTCHVSIAFTVHEFRVSNVSASQSSLF